MNKKILAITQRVEFFDNYKEFRDCLDHSWISFSHKLKYLPIPLANKSNPNELINQLEPSLIVLSGGNSITGIDLNLKNNSIIRDNFENNLIKIAIKKNIPILGVCRGMQMLNIFFGGKLRKIKGHVNQTHSIKIISKKIKQKKIIVNSFHNFGIMPEDLSSELSALAICNNNSIESFYHNKHKILGIMWHPERMDKTKQTIQLIKEFLL